MRKIEITAYDLAERYTNIKEVSGQMSNPIILAMLKLDQKWPDDDKVPWCSAFVNWIAWNLRLPRSKSLRARSWLLVGKEIPLNDAEIGFDIVILKRGGGKQPGPEVINAPGHVGLFAGFPYYSPDRINLLGGNQNDSVNISSYEINRILGVRRLY